MKNYFFEKGRDFFDVKETEIHREIFFHQILLFIAYYTQIEYLGSFIPHDRVLNTPVAYDLYFNHKQLLKIQRLIYDRSGGIYVKLLYMPKIAAILLTRSPDLQCC